MKGWPIMTHLFVYGSLLPRVASRTGVAERLRLSAEGDYLGDAHISGQLLNLGAYPGLIEGNGTVHGGVYLLRTPEETLAWLDAYEGLTGGNADDYRRQPLAVTKAAGTVVIAEVYVFIGPRSGHTHVPSGRWTGPGRRKRPFRGGRKGRCGA